MSLAPRVADGIAARSVDEPAIADLVDDGDLLGDLDRVRGRQAFEDIPVPVRAISPSVYLGRAFRDIGRELFVTRAEVREVYGGPNPDLARSGGDSAGHQQWIGAPQRCAASPYGIPSHLVRGNDLFQVAGVALGQRLARLRAPESQKANVQDSSPSLRRGLSPQSAASDPDTFAGSTPPATGVTPALRYASAVGDASPAEGSILTPPQSLRFDSPLPAA